MKLKELLLQALAESDQYIVNTIEDREIVHADVRAVASAKCIRQRTSLMKSLDVNVISVSSRDDNQSYGYTDVYQIIVESESFGGDFSNRYVFTSIPMLISISCYGEINIEIDQTNNSILRANGRLGEDEVIDLPTYGDWLQYAAGKSLIKEWITWHGILALTGRAQRTRLNCFTQYRAIPTE